MEPWQTLVIALLTPASGGSIWVGIRWWTARRDRLVLEKRAHEDALQARKEAHDNQLMSRLEAMQKGFLEALQVRDAKDEQRRQEHLADVRFMVEKMAKVADVMESWESQRPKA